MNRILLSIAIAGSMLFAAACSSTSEKGEGMEGGMGDAQSQFEKVLKDAEAAYKDVDQMGGAWVFTNKQIEEAKTKAAAKKYDEALALAKEAYDQSVLAKAQFESQKKAGPTLF